MPVVRAFDKTGLCIKGIDPTKNVPVDIVSVEIENDSFTFDDNDDDSTETLDYNTLSRILSLTSQRLQQISISSRVTLSAEYLTFFVSTFQKTDCLRLQDSLHDAAEFGCLVAGLSQPDGLREMQMAFCTPCNRDLKNHLQLLLRGISFASSLEKLHLIFRYRLDGLLPALRNALMMNRSLKSLCLELSWYADDGSILPEVFQTAARNKHMKDLTLRISGGHKPTLLKEAVWVPTLCQRECTIERLCLHGIKLDIDSLEALGQNTSVKEFAIQGASLSCFESSNILRCFKSLVSVNLGFNNLRDISLFEHLLLEENPTLQSLNLEFNDIRKEDMTSFLKKLSQMKSLRDLQLNGNPFIQSRSCILAFEKAVYCNNSNLERVQYSRRGGEEKDSAKGSDVNTLPSLLSTSLEGNTEGYGAREKRLLVQLSLNRFGRRHFLGGSSNTLSSNLWPLILERASNLRYYSSRDGWKRPSMECTRVDVVYWLLREKVFV